MSKFKKCIKIIVENSVYAMKQRLYQSKFDAFIVQSAEIDVEMLIYSSKNFS